MTGAKVEEVVMGELCIVLGQSSEGLENKEVVGEDFGKRKG